MPLGRPDSGGGAEIRWGKAAARTAIALNEPSTWQSPITGLTLEERIRTGNRPVSSYLAAPPPLQARFSQCLVDVRSLILNGRPRPV